MPVSAISLLLSFLAALLFSGCAAIPLEPTPELSSEARAGLGRITAARARFVPYEMLQRPVTKSGGAAAGFAGGAAIGAASGATMSLMTGPFAPVFIAPFSVAGGVLGAGVGTALGAVEGVSADELRRAEPAVVAAMEAERAQEAMLNALLEEAARRGFHLQELEGAGPAAPSEAGSYLPAALGGTDTVVEVSVMDFSLFGEGAFNPPLSLLVNVRARVVRVRDDSVIYEHVFRCESLPRQFTQWAAESARLVHKDAGLCRMAISRNVVKALFGPGR